MLHHFWCCPKNPWLHSRAWEGVRYKNWRQGNDSIALTLQQYSCYLWCLLSMPICNWLRSCRSAMLERNMTHLVSSICVGMTLLSYRTRAFLVTLMNGGTIVCLLRPNRTRSENVDDHEEGTKNHLSWVKHGIQQISIDKRWTIRDVLLLQQLIWRLLVYAYVWMVVRWHDQSSVCTWLIDYKCKCSL